MALSEATIIQQNPWWADPAGFASVDPHLRRLTEQPVRLPAQVSDRIPLHEPGIHVLRGPRQVGKSTELKLLVKAAVDAGIQPRRIWCLSLDLLAGRALEEVSETITLAKRLSRGGGAGLLLLDEVTIVRDWQLAVKHLWDTGVIDRDVVVCTGSSAQDLRGGVAERLPGRRGEGRDHLLLPRSFATFAGALDPTIPASPGLAPGELAADVGQAVLEDARVYLPALEEALSRYMSFGGLPAAVAEAVTGAAEPSPQTRRIVYDALVREVARRGASEPAARALLERILRSLGSKISWSRLGREMDVPLGQVRRAGAQTHGSTVRAYIELLAEAYALLVVYFRRPDSATGSIPRDKKIYFADPLLHTVAAELAPGLTTDTAALVENLTALALYRHFEPTARQAETWGFPERLHVWEAGVSELDFVCGLRPDLSVVEVKYQASPDLRRAAAAARAFAGRPVIVVTRQHLERREKYVLVPAALFLWALG